MLRLPYAGAVNNLFIPNTQKLVIEVYGQLVVVCTLAQRLRSPEFEFVSRNEVNIKYPKSTWPKDLMIRNVVGPT